jgi:hypothetical protein
MSRRRLGTLFAWLGGGFLIAYSYAFIMATTTDSQDVSECRGVVSAVTSRHSIPSSVSAPGQAAIFCDLGVHFPLLKSYDSVFIYGVLDKTPQQSIVADLRNFHHTSHTRNLLVRFFEQENWRTWSDPASGRSGGSRGPEAPILTVWIK